MKLRIAAAAAAVIMALCAFVSPFSLARAGYTVPDGFNSADYAKMAAFLETKDAEGVKNGERIREDYDPSDPETWVGSRYNDEDEIEYFGVDFPEIGGEHRIYRAEFDGLGMVGALDLSGLDELAYLYCANGGLTSVNVSGCSALDVAAFENNSVASLNLSGCSALEGLYCCGNALKSIGLSDCVSLEKLECDRNELNSLNVSKCTALTSLDCSGNSISSLSLSACTLLTSLNCLGNPLTSLDLSAISGMQIDRVSAKGSGTVSYIQGREKNDSGLDEYRTAAEAVPADGETFLGWYNGSGTKLSGSSVLDLEGSEETVVIAHFSGSAAVTLGVPVITLSSVDSTGKVKVSWEEVEGAVKYEVWRSAEKNGTYVKAKTTTALSYTNTAANAGDKYWYKVRAVASDGTAGEFCSPRYRYTHLPKPVVTGTHVASTGNNKLSWEEVDGAKEYKVYRSTEKNGEYSLMKTTTNLSYTNSNNTAPGETYYYYVVAVHATSAANSAASATKTLTVDLPRPVVTISLTNAGKPKLAWEAVEGAKEYKVYRSLESGTGYSLVFTTTKLSYSNTGAAAGTTYYYKVMAIHEKSAANSAYSQVVSITTK